jgi:hypothetical protein
MKKFVEMATNAAILVAALLLCWKIIDARRPPAGNSISDGSELVGVRLPSPPSYTWKQNPETLVLAIKSGCRFCENSFPFYRRLIDDAKNHGSRVHLLAVMPDPPESGHILLGKNELHLDALFAQNLETVKVNATPTLLLLNAEGRIEKAWIGQLDKKQEDAVLGAVEH